MFENRQKMWSKRNHIASPKREATIHVSVTIKLHCILQCISNNNSISKGPYLLYCHLPHTTSTVNEILLNLASIYSLVCENVQFNPICHEKDSITYTHTCIHPSYINLYTVSFPSLSLSHKAVFFFRCFNYGTGKGYVINN